MKNIKAIKEMNIKELKEHMRNLWSVENTITNNNKGWTHPATQKRANLLFNENRKEMNEVNNRLEELGYFDEN